MDSTTTRRKPSRFDQPPPGWTAPSTSLPVQDSPFPQKTDSVYQSPPSVEAASSSSVLPKSEAPPQPSRPSIVGKRRMGGRILKTGILTAEKRLKTEDEHALSAKGSSSAKEPANAYLEEIKKYSEHLCAEERHARPLVK